MAKSAVYQPGVGNIGSAQICRRRMSGFSGLATAVVFLAVAFGFGWPASWRLLVALG